MMSVMEPKADLPRLAVRAIARGVATGIFAILVAHGLVAKHLIGREDKFPALLLTYLAVGILFYAIAWMSARKKRRQSNSLGGVNGR